MLQLIGYSDIHTVFRVPSLLYVLFPVIVPSEYHTWLPLVPRIITLSGCHFICVRSLDAGASVPSRYAPPRKIVVLLPVPGIVCVSCGPVLTMLAWLLVD
jgi:hypothetical protein